VWMPDQAVSVGCRWRLLSLNMAHQHACACCFNAWGLSDPFATLFVYCCLMANLSLPGQEPERVVSLTGRSPPCTGARARGRLRAGRAGRSGAVPWDTGDNHSGPGRGGDGRLRAGRAGRSGAVPWDTGLPPARTAARGQPGRRRPPPRTDTPPLPVPQPPGAGHRPQGHRHAAFPGQ